MRVLDDVKSISTGNLKQRVHELRSELALVNRKNVKLKVAILMDSIKVNEELEKRDGNNNFTKK